MSSKLVGIYQLPNYFCIQPMSETDIGFFTEENIVFTVGFKESNLYLGNTLIEAFNYCKGNVPAPSREILDEGVYCVELLKATGFKNIRKLGKSATYIHVEKEKSYCFSPLHRHISGFHLGVRGHELFLPLDSVPETIGDAVYTTFTFAK